MQNVACPTTMVQKENGISSRPNAERRLMPVMIPGSAIGRTSSSEIESRPKNFERHTAAAASEPNTMASAVAIAATRSDNPSAAWMSSRASATANHLLVNAGGGNTNVASSALNAYSTMIASGTCRNTTLPVAASVSAQPAPRLERIERPQFARDRQVHAHDRDRHDRHRGRQRDIACGALVQVDGLADEGLRAAD